MKDSVIKGTGNSRYLKSSLEGITTWEQFRAALAAGTLPVDLNGIDPEGFQQLGDPLNKVTLLKDGTAEKYGMDNTAVPDDVLDLLSKAAVKGSYQEPDVPAGTTWETGIVSGTEDLRAIENITYFVNNVFVVPPSGKNITLGVVSTDGKTWTPTQFSGAADNVRVRNGMCYKDGIYYLLGVDGNPYVSRIYSSADLKTWTKRAEFKKLNRSGAYLFHSETLKKLIFISCGGDIFVSSDGDTWEQCAFKIPTFDVNSINGKNGVDEPDGFYIAIGDSNARTINVYRLTGNSAELVWKSEPTSSTGTQYFSFIKFKGKYFIYTNQGFHVSDDLKNWQYISGNFNNDGNFPYNLDHSETTILSITYDKTLFTSDDGFTFNKYAIDSSYDYGGVVYGNGVFAAQTRPKNNVYFSHFVYTQDTTFAQKPMLTDVLGRDIEIALKQVGGAKAIESGTYVGTGETYLSLSFKTPPRLLFISREGPAGDTNAIFAAAMIPDQIQTGCRAPVFIVPKSGYVSGGYMGLEDMGKTSLKFSASSLNVSGVTYRYVMVSK